MTDPVLVVLGGAVVKTAIRLWVGPNVLGDNLTADLTNLLESRVTDATERRKLRRRFEEMEDIVADQVLAALAGEFQGLEEGERNAAVGAVTETFNRARVTSGELFSQDLDPFNLEKFVRKFAGDATRDLSWGGIQLYDRVLARSCAYILEIADKLPAFQTGAFAELLRRDSQILARLEDVLARLPAPVKDGSASDRVETAYRQRIAKVFDRLDLFGLDFRAQWYSLSIAYVNLTVSVEQADENEGGDFEFWLARCPRLLIEGLAGSGKTTILQWIAVRTARRDFEGPAAQFNEHIPFFLRLREYAGGTLPQPEEFLDKIAALLAPEQRSWPREQLRSGRAFVLIDGLDEVPESQRPAVLAWVHYLTELFPEARYIVTTRPGAVKKETLDEANFIFATLDPMDPALMATFVAQWHRAMREWHKDAESQEQLDSFHTALVKTLETDRFLSELANTPLLAGLICALNQHLNGQLPRRRGEVYEKALAMFYERDRKRRVSSDLVLDMEATYHLLGDLALWMIRNGVIEATAESARDILLRSATSLPNVASDATALYSHLLLRSGLLREPTVDFVDFAHRTFQEYLGARALVESDNIGELVRNADDDQWREVVILASGQGNIRQTTDLLHGLIRSKWRGKQHYRRRLVAIACLDEIRGADPSVVTEIDRTIPELLPPRSMDQAEVLSHAGERLIPHLARASESLQGPECAPAIRSAALIGGPDALTLLAKIARNNHEMPKDRRHQLNDEFTRAWQYFDPPTYAAEVLTPFGLYRMRATSARLLSGLSMAPTIREITLAGFIADDTDLSALDGTQIRSLIIAGGTMRSLSGIIRNWTTVENVELRACLKLEHIAALSVLPNLKGLWIYDCNNINRREIDTLSVDFDVHVK